MNPRGRQLKTCVNKTSVEKIREASSSSANAHSDPISVLIRKADEESVGEMATFAIANPSAGEENAPRTITPLPMLKNNVRNIANVPWKMHA
jgi:hypothetical protein